MSQNACCDDNDNTGPREFKNKKNNSLQGIKSEENILNHSREHDKKSRRSADFINKREKKDFAVAFIERDRNVMTSTPVAGGSKRNNNTNSSLRKSTGGSPMCLGDFIVGSMKPKRRSLGNELKHDTNEQTKPKKRVAPITLSKTVTMKDNFVCDTSFASTDERSLLKSHKDEITNDFIQQTQEQNSKTLYAAFKDQILEPTQSKPLLEIDLTKTTNKKLILRIVDIFTILMDLNLSVNVLTEISFLVNLLNTEVDPFSRQMAEEIIEDHTNILKNLNNAIYFALTTLTRLKSLVVMLDVKTINILMKNERITCNDADLTRFLQSLFQYKSNISSKLIDGNNVPGYSYVFFQQENDSKSNFPSEKEFGAFKKQRDMFFAIFK